DQAFLGLALAMGQSPAPAGRPGTTRPAEATASVTNLISNPVGGTAGETMIARTAPFAAGGPPFASFGLDAGNAVSLEPTIHLDHLSRYLNHLHELRRINEGDDIADSPGYALNLVRIPVSISPGQHTQAGHGAEITILADPQLGDDLLPTTVRNLVVNDLVDMLAPSLTFAVNTSAVRDGMEALSASAGIVRNAPPSIPPIPAGMEALSASAGIVRNVPPSITPIPAGMEALSASAGIMRDAPPSIPPVPRLAPGASIHAMSTLLSTPPSDSRPGLSEHWPAAALQRMRSRSVSVPTAKMRRARMPLPPEQLVDVIGERQIVLLLESTHEALAAHPANTPCIEYPDVRGFLGEELQAAYEFLGQERQRQVWAELPGWNLAELIRSRRMNELELRRRGFFDSLGVDDAPPTVTTSGEYVPNDADTCLGPCSNILPPRLLCRTTTAVLAWAILVESALLNERLAEDMRESGSAKGHASGLAGACAGPFYGPDPAPEARAAFNDYVRRRWPIRVFALDPVTQEQNVEEQYAQRREMQVAMAMAFASGRSSSQVLARYARRLETDLATISLNKTAVGFTHGHDTFGWRFYPRIQPPPTRGNLATFTDTLCGTSPTARDLASRRVEPGTRECTALIVMPSFVPFVSFDVRTNWFSLTHPKATDQSMRQAMLLSRSVQSMHERAATCRSSADGYRSVDKALLLRRVDQLDRELPLQSMLAQIPHENTAGGFELFNTGITDLAPELIGWYGSHGIDPAGTTVLFFVGKGFSVHDTSIVAGGRPVKTTLLGRQLLRAEIPPGVRTILPAAAGGCGDATAHCGRSCRSVGRHARTVRLASNAEPLPAPAEPATPGAAATADGNRSLRLTLPPAAG
ncbi:MAG: hypothetical protein ACKOK8_00455, partial [Planctomycetia bacterium]